MSEKKNISSLASALKDSSKELIKIFEDLNNKLSALHDNISGDFLRLSSEIKNYNNEIRTIAENATQVSVLISEKNSSDFLNILHSVHERLELIKEYFEKQIGANINALEDIRNKIVFKIESLNNFKNNTTIITDDMEPEDACGYEYRDNDNKEMSSDIDAESINDLIEDTRSVISLIEGDLSRLNDIIVEGLIKLRGLKESYNSNIELVLNQIHSSITILFEEYERAVTHEAPRLSIKTKHCFNNISNLIIEIQYHDIIRQKLEHIHSTHKNLIQELSLVKENNNEDQLIKQAKFISIIPEITKLHVAQLNRSNKECQLAFKNINSNLSKIWDDSTAISVFSIDFFDYTRFSNRNYLEDLKDKLNNSTAIIEKNSFANKEFKSEINLIAETIDMLSDYVGKIDNVWNELLLIDDGIKDARLKKNRDLLSKIVRQMEVLSHDEIIVAVNKSLKKGSELLRNIIHFTSASNFHDDFKNLSNNILVFLNPVNDQFANENDSSNNNNINLSTKISKEIKDLIGKIKSSDLFEQITGEIIDELEHVFDKANIQKINIDQDEKDDLLKGIKELYTMNSEHLIHNRIFTSTIEIFDNDDITGEENNDDNLELF